jgi:hypothetical protein
MMPVTEAVQVAARHLQLLIPDADDILLEEVEISDDDQYWLVTLGFAYGKDGAAASKDAPLTPLARALAATRPRKYKVFRINRATGEVRSMKIRERENV